MAKTKLERGERYTVTVFDGGWNYAGGTFVRETVGTKSAFSAGASPRSTTIYSGASLQFAHHDVNTAKVATLLSGGSLLIELRLGGTILQRYNIRDGRVLNTDLLPPTA